MNRTIRTIAVVAGALGAAALASLLVYRALERVSRPTPVAMTTVVIAARDVPAGTMLTSDDVKAVAWPANTKLATSFVRIDEVVGRGTIDILRENEPLTAGKLAARGAGAGLPPTIPAGMRAISIHVNEIIGVAGFVTPGSRVDVLVTLDKQGAARAAADDTMTRVVVSNVQVLTAGTRYDQDKAREDGKPIPTSVVTLMVTPDDAERVALAQNEGKINLTLRNPLDVDPTSTHGAQIASLLGRQTTPPPIVERPTVRARPVRAVAVAVPPPAPEVKPRTVETIRAAKRTEEPIR
jgi:pilus assembly protein CpaB